MAKSISEMFNREFTEKLTQTLQDLPPILGEEAVNFFHTNFDNQGWNGNSFQAWKQRKKPTKWGKKDETSRSLLVKTGRGRRSIRVGRIERNKVFVYAFGGEASYMKVHNKGFRGIVTQNVNPFTRRVKGKTQQVKSHKRTINQNIPQRKSVGGKNESMYLKARLRRITILELKQALQ